MSRTGAVRTGLPARNPLVNEVVIPLGDKDRWNASDPENDTQFLRVLPTRRCTALENVLYPAAATMPRRPDRDDLVAVLLTGHPGA